MALRSSILVVWFLAGTVVLALALLRLHRRGKIDAGSQRIRRGAGHALLGMQEFIEPSVEFVFQAENVEQKRDVGSDALEDDQVALLADLAESLSRDPVNHDEVRRHLAGLQRSGIDWREAFDQAVRAELAARPYRAPALPPHWRVAPNF
jgi:hypothetical protein